MSGNTHLAHYQVFETNWQELQQLPEAHLAVVSLLQFAVSEANTFMKVYLCQDHPYTQEKALDSVINIHKFTVLRTWSSRLFEIIEFLEQGKNKEFKEDVLLSELTEKALEGFEEIRSGNGYEIARAIRHEATNHYSLKAAKKNLNHVPAAMDCRMYLAKNRGNEFFPLGEAVMFHARLNRHWASKAASERRKRLEDWLDWCIKANDLASKTHALFVSKLVFEPLGRNEVVRRQYWVSEDFAADRMNKLTPMYFQGIGI